MCKAVNAAQSLCDCHLNEVPVRNLQKFSHVRSWRRRMPKNRLQTLASDRQSLHALAHAIMCWARFDFNRHRSSPTVDITRYPHIYLFFSSSKLRSCSIMHTMSLELAEPSLTIGPNMCKHTLQTVCAQLRRNQ